MRFPPDAARYDLPMSHGVDTRDHAWAVQQTTIDYLEQVVRTGGYVEGAADPTLDRLRVVAE